MSNSWKQAKCLTLTYVTKGSYVSLNGSDKEADNISSIKKIQMNDGKEYPYCSSQAVRRALREQLSTLGCVLSEGVAGEQEKGAATTQCDPQQYIDDDLFGFMRADKETVKRTSPVRVSPLIALDPYRGDLDFATNYMSTKAGGNPNIFESEIHSGFYRGTILIELDRVGEKTEGDKYELQLSPLEKIERVSLLLDAIQNLWTVGRQSRFLSDMSPKFVSAALLRVKNPIFLESVFVKNNEVNMSVVKQTLADFESVLIAHTMGERKGFFAADHDDVQSIGQSFQEMKQWLHQVYEA
ncbi:type I-B CRISPR-associated protein Cas7/Cst2/DevR [Aneurinibacillus thermoaerophilus]|uniref:CRISPR-associated autoregulator, Cst2 family n=1 Tax=Aneurinibacillus thermoaerophilus TaxID=143495 RepID=A0A1G8CGX3_ANETH|nr:type I-B CRISPR-associated protein Cas7/Cst2/DevR [Aneurinibacillus thermoaerophilus]MED0674135.1 type I-B CRISPR-associated protein Cas7/Cst2/DevR [Aneurinibacillus thermoaerophilus]MED0680467.1 type I-B CRISPR-associated protein Cas7/Cst2/DevR [Aneurinibacillus thermoaerophilus]MED0758605.1 type I-B CRISPR-associated protein Cas7/Cst2/DevR [Aneurinibacillus thermoaerophilus]MED0761874.1 type I-B CRISPR-associated protein Cas7/Cst2/DevR [Aneurinibacillus thermoaerophilus]MED0766085.1 type 